MAAEQRLADALIGVKVIKEELASAKAGLRGLLSLIKQINKTAVKIKIPKLSGGRRSGGGSGGGGAGGSGGLGSLGDQLNESLKNASRRLSIFRSEFSKSVTQGGKGITGGVRKTALEIRKLGVRLEELKRKASSAFASGDVAKARALISQIESLSRTSRVASADINSLRGSIGGLANDGDRVRESIKNSTRSIATFRAELKRTRIGPEGGLLGKSGFDIQTNRLRTLELRLVNLRRRAAEAFRTGDNASGRRYIQLIERVGASAERTAKGIAPLRRSLDSLTKSVSGQFQQNILQARVELDRFGRVGRLIGQGSLNRLQQRLNTLKRDFADGKIGVADYTRQLGRLRTLSKVAFIGTAALSLAVGALAPIFGFAARSVTSFARAIGTVVLFPVIGAVRELQLALRQLTFSANIGSQVRKTFSEFGTIQQELTKARVALKLFGDSGERAFVGVRNRLLDIARTTIFTAQEASNALRQLVRAGLTARQALNALPDTLNLAQLGDLEAGPAVDIITAIKNQFSLASTEIGRVVDVLASASTATRVGIGDIGNAFVNVTQIAADFGLSLEEAAGALVRLTQAGATGSKAGVGLRITLSKLFFQSERLDKILEPLGVKFADFTNQLGTRFRADGLIDFLTAISKSETALRDVKEFIGARGAQGSPLLNDAEALRAAIRDIKADTGLAEKQAKDLSGTMESIGKIAKSIATDIRFAFATSVFNRFRKDIEKIVPAISAAGEQIKILFRVFSSDLEAVLPRLKEFTINFLEIFAAANTAGFGVLVGVIDGIAESTKGIRNDVADTLKSLLQIDLRSTEDAVNSIADAFNGVAERAKAAGDAIGDFITIHIAALNRMRQIITGIDFSPIGIGLSGLSILANREAAEIKAAITRARIERVARQNTIAVIDRFNQQFEKLKEAAAPIEGAGKRIRQDLEGGAEAIEEALKGDIVGLQQFLTGLLELNNENPQVNAQQDQIKAAIENANQLATNTETISGLKTAVERLSLLLPAVGAPVPVRIA